ncbi:poly(A)-specific ribonuclease PARN-like isoform X7 [Zingiber officinale]|uniref:poly(A)-specific ribonuclease PARN-like isoform X7 n=1 Tax=Zingiber officinale TaxID=94328 RepID=UPI001C4C4244|nr:poly(A)-specific ribonuclease PARN-like isoform X7 [Zingiber officinale]
MHAYMKVVKKHFNDLMYVRVVDEDNSWQRRVVYVDTNEDKAVLMKDVLEDLRKNAEKRIKSSVGFRHVVDLLASTGKLIVGHNCLLVSCRIPRANVALATTTKSKYSLNKSGWFINLYKRNNLSHEIRRQGGQKEEIEGMHAISSRMEEQIIERKKNLLLHKV